MPQAHSPQGTGLSAPQDLGRPAGSCSKLHPPTHRFSPSSIGTIVSCWKFLGMDFCVICNRLECRSRAADRVPSAENQGSCLLYVDDALPLESDFEQQLLSVRGGAKAPSSTDLLTQQPPEIAKHPSWRRQAPDSIRSLFHLLLLKYGPSITWQLVRNAQAQAPPQTCRIRI